jgi:cbb3-type cytochrome oxidase cytochrome c subunit
VHHRDPRAVTPDSIMPAFQHLTDDEMDALIAYLESLT